MKVYTKLVMDWDGNVLEEESYDYDGPVAECKGGGGSKSQTTVQKADPWKGAQPHLKTIYDDAGSLYKGGGPQYFPGQTYVNRTGLENQAQTMGLNYALGGMQQQANAMQNASMSALNAPDLANNPYVGQQADAITRRMTQQLTEQALPSIRGGAVASGQLGGSRQGIAEGQAIGRTSEAIGDSLAQLYGENYANSLDAQGRALALAPTTMQAGLNPAAAVGDVGAYQRGEQELALQDAMARHNYAENQPYQNLNYYNSIVSGAPWNSSSTSDMSGGGRSGFSASGALGGAMAGAALGPIGMIGGGILGGLF